MFCAKRGETLASELYCSLAGVDPSVQAELQRENAPSCREINVPVKFMAVTM